MEEARVLVTREDSPGALHSNYQLPSGNSRMETRVRIDYVLVPRNTSRYANLP